METITEQSIQYTDTEEVCCGITLQPEYNCVENYCEFSLNNFARMVNCCCQCDKYIYEGNECNDCTSIDCKWFFPLYLIGLPFALLNDIICSPCKTFLYCEKCINKNKKLGTEPGLNDFIIDKQPN